MKSVYPCTSACESRSWTGADRQAVSCSRFVPPPLTVAANSTSRSVASAPAVEDHVFDVLEQILRNVFVDDQLAGIDDAHVEAGLDRMVEERRVHRFADDIVAAERERQVAHAAAHLHARAGRLDDAGRLDEVDRIGVVLFETGRDGEDVRVEDDVRGVEARALGQQRVGALADRHLPLDRVGLALLVERHDDHAGPVAPDDRRLLEKIRLAFLQADRIHDRLALHALQAGLNHRPLGAVDHERHARDFRFGRDVVQELGHRLLGIEHALVHVHVDQVGAATDLVERHLRRVAVLAGADQPREPRRAGHVGPLANHLKVRVGADRERFEAGELRVLRFALHHRGHGGH